MKENIDKKIKFSKYILLTVIVLIMVFCNVVSFNTIIRSMDVIDKKSSNDYSHVSIHKTSSTNISYVELANLNEFSISNPIVVLDDSEILEDETNNEDKTQIIDKKEVNDNEALVEKVEASKDRIIENKKETVKEEIKEETIVEDKKTVSNEDTKKEEITKEEKEEPVLQDVPTEIEDTKESSVKVSSDIATLLTNFNLTDEQFYILVAIVAAEGGSTYEDSYAVINTIYNRTKSGTWVNYVGRNGVDGTNMFSQATAPGQFTVYAGGSYLKHMYKTDIPAYSAVVNFLSTLEIMHNFLSFRSGSSGREGTQFVPGGNIYFNEL